MMDIIALKSPEKRLELRIGSVVDWRDIIRNPDRNTLAGKKISKTKSMHDRIAHAKFYAQHGGIFSKYFAGKESKAVVLDQGCGAADGVENWANRCKEYHGYDGSLEMLELARKYIPKSAFPNTFFYFEEINSKHFPDEGADFVISSEVFEHVDEPEQHLDYCFDKLKPGGVLSLSTPCAAIYLYPCQFFGSLLLRPRHLYKVLNAHKFWSEVLPWHPAIRPAQLARMAEKQGFTVEEHFTCLWYIETPIRLSMRLSTLLEKAGFQFHLPMAERWFRFLESLTENRLPFLKFIGTRQFLVARKPK